MEISTPTHREEHTLEFKKSVCDYYMRNNNYDTERRYSITVELALYWCAQLGYNIEERIAVRKLRAEPASLELQKTVADYFQTHTLIETANKFCISTSLVSPWYKKIKGKRKFGERKRPTVYTEELARVMIAYYGVHGPSKTRDKFSIRSRALYKLINKYKSRSLMKSPRKLLSLEDIKTIIFSNIPAKVLARKFGTSLGTIYIIKQKAKVNNHEKEENEQKGKEACQ